MNNYLPECHIVCKYCGKSMQIDDIDRTQDIISIYHLCECGASAIEERKNKKTYKINME